MRTFDFTAIFCVLFFVVTIAQAGPIRMQARKTLDVWVPKILEPTSQSLWNSGAEARVSWDTTGAPKQISNGGRVVLNDGAHWSDISGPFDLSIGSINVQVPANLPTGEYSIILFGDSGNESEKFTIKGQAVTPTPRPTPIPQ